MALAAGVSAFFFMAFVGRTDLVQTVALYGVQLELPRALSGAGALYVVALFGYVAAIAVLLLTPGAPRLAGLGVCLVGLAGYQTSSPVALGLSLCGLVALATGATRIGAAASKREVPLSAAQWQALLEDIAGALAGAQRAGEAPPAVEVSAAAEPAAATGERDVGVVKLSRRGRPVEVRLRRARSTVRELEVTVGAPEVGRPIATIESHEAWLARRPEDRLPLPRMKTGDPVFDWKVGVHGQAPVREADIRRRILRLAEGTITLWNGAARFLAPGNPAAALHRFTLAATVTTVRAVVEVVDTLIELVDADEDTAPPDAAQ